MTIAIIITTSSYMKHEVKLLKQYGNQVITYILNLILNPNLTRLWHKLEHNVPLAFL